MGNGAKLINTLLDALRAAGSKGVSLGQSPRNLRAYKFYRKLGFHELGRADDDVWMGMRFCEPVPAPVHPRFSSGVIEGFYGRPWSLDQRKELVGNMSKWGMNLYMYSPKDDRKHRAAWREVYTPQECGQLKELIDACGERGIGFVYGIAPGLDIVHSSIPHRDLLQAKVKQVLDLGVRRFAILFDDISDKLDPEDATKFGTLAVAQASVANALVLFIKEILIGASEDAALSCQFLFCPTEYCSKLSVPSLEASQYLATLGTDLIPEIRVLWTGTDIISKTITVDHVAALYAILKRPIVIWDNFHANDYDNGRRLYLGPYSGREARVPTCGCVEGILSNPNCEYEANFVPLRTLSLFVAASSSSTSTPYYPRTAYETACAEWLPRFNTDCAADAPLFDLPSLIALGDMFYTPFSYGPFAESFLALARRVIISRDETGLADLIASGATIQRLYSTLTQIHHRELCYTLYRFMWDAKEEGEVICKFGQWYMLPEEVRGAEGTPSPYHIPGPIRGGFVAHCQRIVEFDDATGLFRAARDNDIVALPLAQRLTPP